MMLNYIFSLSKWHDILFTAPVKVAKYQKYHVAYGRFTQMADIKPDLV